MKRTVRYFDDYGPENTGETIQSVAERLPEGGIEAVVIASSTGATALSLVKTVPDLPPVYAVCDPPWAIGKVPHAGRISPETKAELEGLGVNMVDDVPYASRAYSTGPSDNVYEALDLLVVVFDAFRMVGGNGLKVAIEAALMATNSGRLQPGRDVIALAGTRDGLDTAIVVKSAYSINIFSKDAGERPEVREILAMPRVKEWYW